MDLSQLYLPVLSYLAHFIFREIFWARFGDVGSI